MKDKILYLLTVLIFISGLIVGFFFGQKVTNEKRNLITQITFEPIKDCFVEFNYSGRLEGKYWTISDFVLRQDWEKNGNRNCAAEVGEILHKYLESNKDF